MTTIPLITEQELRKNSLNTRGRILRRMMLHGVFYWPYISVKMPLLALSRARVRALDLTYAETQLPFALTNRNPFGSMYFAAQMMAAEMAIGALVLLHNENHSQNFSPIVRHIDVVFQRAAYEKITFRCDEGVRVARLLERALRTGERVEDVFTVIGSTEKEGDVMKAHLTWSVRHKKG